MADSRLETSLYPVHDLALLPSACVPVIRLRTHQRATNARNIAKAAYAVGLPRIARPAQAKGSNICYGGKRLRFEKSLAQST